MAGKFCGPFYTKNPDGTYSYADMCKECAFGDEASNMCCLNPCTYLYAASESEDEDDEE